jgi:hypothetical protein
VINIINLLNIKLRAGQTTALGNAPELGSGEKEKKRSLLHSQSPRYKAFYLDNVNGVIRNLNWCVKNSLV